MDDVWLTVWESLCAYDLCIRLWFMLLCVVCMYAAVYMRSNVLLTTQYAFERHGASQWVTCVGTECGGR
ncbi:hypothetical protein BU24DRAFT_428052 [Aaosphaeria arxii CBS 175.79]|uniref:Uncharacterized protein n=1 Tax=Aaosphaeria arxii CBS 175.79 TaxID=1450172 RepID=A0A6A5XAQ8_9PLEO|nr:uncharacterized protein BU24DRAFT_428052 [Aaosphaeria arxii CBS 175.79]KAF2010021.1 hypothetical protein BU24DRAFT_428052 [Aaosphaeria arxii CBS 175.79]